MQEDHRISCFIGLSDYQDGVLDGSVGIETCYGLGLSGIESRSRRDFAHQYRPALWLTQLPVQWVSGLSRG